MACDYLMIVQIPTPMNANPASSFNVAGCTNRVMKEPNTTASNVETMRALDAAANTYKGGIDFSVAYNSVAI